MKWVGSFVFLTAWTALTSHACRRAGSRRIDDESAQVGHDFWEPRRVHYISVKALRTWMAAFAVLGIVLLGFGIAAATGLYVAPSN
jgi:hypothetical protein